MPDPTLIQSPSFMILGPAGSGKTYSITTLVEAGLEVFVSITEPNGIDTLLDAMREKNLPLEKLHWHYTPPTAPGWSAITNMARTINTQDYESITKLKQGIDKNSTNQIMKFLSNLANFKCDHCGHEFGDVTSWGPDRAYVIDSLSGLNVLVMDNTIGFKPAAHQGEWGVAMNLEDKLLLKLTSDLKCFFVLIGHIDREVDEISGAQRVMAAALGRKNAPRIARYFSEIVLCKRNGTKFSWATTDTQADLKNRALPISADLPPSFKSAVDVYRRRLTQVAAPQQAASPATQAANS